MRRFLRDNALTLFFLALMAMALVGQALSGHARYNDQQLANGGHPISLPAYVTSADYAVDVAENWQSEYLQFFLYIVVTVWLVQRGSPESKTPRDIGTESDERQRVGRHARAESPAWARAGGLRRILFSRSLGMAMGTFFLLSWLAQSVAGRAAYNGERLAQYQDAVSWMGYAGSADFWNRTFQNWQSEFLAIASMTALSIYLRQRGSPESKPVGGTHGETGT
jgi:hypothetical protein